MAKNSRDGAPDLLALAMRRVRTEVSEGRVPKHPPEDEDASPNEGATEDVDEAMTMP